MWALRCRICRPPAHRGGTEGRERRKREEEERQRKKREEEERQRKQRKEEERHRKRKEEEERQKKQKEEEERQKKQREEEKRQRKQREEEEIVKTDHVTVQILHTPMSLDRDRVVDKHEAEYTDSRHQDSLTVEENDEINQLVNNLEKIDDNDINLSDEDFDDLAKMLNEIHDTETNEVELPVSFEKLIWFACDVTGFEPTDEQHRDLLLMSKNLPYHLQEFVVRSLIPAVPELLMAKPDLHSKVEEIFKKDGLGHMNII